MDTENTWTDFISQAVFLWLSNKLSEIKIMSSMCVELFEITAQNWLDRPYIYNL